MRRTLEIATGFGMTLQGVRTCGDYMFSGHTVCITMLNFFISECKYENISVVFFNTLGIFYKHKHFL